MTATEPVRLSAWTSCGGCAAKWGAAPLRELVRELADRYGAPPAAVRSSVPPGPRTARAMRSVAVSKAIRKGITSGACPSARGAGAGGTDIGSV